MGDGACACLEGRVLVEGVAQSELDLTGLMDRRLDVDHIVGRRLARLEHDVVSPAAAALLAHDQRRRGAHLPCMVSGTISAAEVSRGPCTGVWVLMVVKVGVVCL